MSNAVLFFGIYFIAVWVTAAAAAASCLNSITCPCGSSKVNYIHCVDAESPRKYTCERWTNCLTCKANSTDCVTCPPRRFGPTCIEKETRSINCSDPGIPEGGIRKYSDGSDASFIRTFAKGDSVVFECIGKELILRGSSFITCEAGGKWSASLPQCDSCVTKRSKGICQDPGIPESVSRINPDGTDASTPRTFTEGESVIFYCEGLELALEGPRFITCKSDGTWSDSLPKCNVASYVQQFCGLIQNDKSVIIGTFECELIPDGRMCNVSCGGKDEGQYRCFPGKPWTPELPSCVLPELLFLETSANKPCLDPGLPKGGKRLYADGSDASFPRDFVTGENLIFSCKDGLALQGHSLITCRSNGTWSGLPPKCEMCDTDARKNRTEEQFNFGSCPHIKSPILGTMHCRQMDNLKFCKGSCFPGYFFSKHLKHMVQITLFCDHETWRPLPQFFPCEPAASCSLRLKTFGDFNCSSDKNGTHCDVTCGLTKEYQRLHHCDELGKWSPTLPHCVTPAVEHEKALCLDPGVPEGGRRTTVDGTDASTVRMFEEGESVNFTCKGKHLVLEGHHIISCRSDSRWSASQPNCLSSSSVMTGKISGPFPNGPILILIKIVMFHFLLKFVSSITLTNAIP